MILGNVLIERLVLSSASSVQLHDSCYFRCFTYSHFKICILTSWFPVISFRFIEMICCMNGITFICRRAIGYVSGVFWRPKRELRSFRNLSNDDGLQLSNHLSHSTSIWDVVAGRAISANRLGPELNDRSFAFIFKGIFWNEFLAIYPWVASWK